MAIGLNTFSYRYATRPKVDQVWFLRFNKDQWSKEKSKEGNPTIMAIQIEHEFNAPALALWDIVGTPDRIDWVPGVTECAFDGDVRRLGMPGAGQITERILLHDSKKMRLEYSCIESTPPLDHHLATIQLISLDEDRCLMQWETEVTPVEVEPFIEKSMQGCLQLLEELLQPKSRN